MLVCRCSHSCPFGALACGLLGRERECAPPLDLVMRRCVGERWQGLQRVVRLHRRRHGSVLAKRVVRLRVACSLARQRTDLSASSVESSLGLGLGQGVPTSPVAGRWQQSGDAEGGGMFRGNVGVASAGPSRGTEGDDRRRIDARAVAAARSSRSRQPPRLLAERRQPQRHGYVARRPLPPCGLSGDPTLGLGIEAAGSLVRRAPLAKAAESV